MLGTTGEVKCELINVVFLWTPTCGHTNPDGPAKLTAGCRLGDLPRMMVNRDGWLERDKEIHAISSP